jgi:hypothetical protein
MTDQKICPACRRPRTFRCLLAELFVYAVMLVVSGFVIWVAVNVFAPGVQ